MPVRNIIVILWGALLGGLCASTPLHAQGTIRIGVRGDVENKLDRTKLVGTTAINAGHVPALAMQPEMSKDQPRLRHSVPESRQTRTMSFTTWNHR